MPVFTDVETLFSGIRGGDRVAIGRALTLVESSHPRHAEAAVHLLNLLLPFTGTSQRVGITGTPGAGKSFFLDAYGALLADRGAQVAVLAIDPSSERTGGSLLGDKTRMERLAVHANAFVRPSPARGVLGGVAARTREAMLVLEAAGYTHLFVETVGVGQSETSVSALVDCVLLLVVPGGGDEVQGLKRGIVEHADLLVVHKSDIDAARTREAVRAYRGALHLFPPRGDGWSPQVLAVSSVTSQGLDKLDAALKAYFDSSRQNQIADRRTEQRAYWLQAALRERLLARFFDDEAAIDALTRAEADVRAGHLDIRAAVDKLLPATKAGA